MPLFQHGSTQTPQTNIMLPCDSGAEKPKSSISNANNEPNQDIKYSFVQYSVAQYWVNNCTSHVTSFQVITGDASISLIKSK